MLRPFYTLLAFLTATAAFAQKDYTRLVNPFIGTGGHGHTFPGATLPFGAVQLSPDSRMADWDGSSGYHYSDSLIYGFSHTHLSGTGIPDYCDILMMPVASRNDVAKEEYRSTFSHQREKAEPGYYRVFLDKPGVRAELTTSLHAGFHQYTFPEGRQEGHVIIDLRHRDLVLDANLTQQGSNAISGWRRSRSWANDQHCYFFLRSEQSIRGIRYQVDNLGRKVAAVVSFAVPRDGKVRFKVGISGVDTTGARKNVDAEIKDWNFQRVRDEAKATWNTELRRIEVEGGTPDERTVFYTALYHCLIQPNIFQDVDGRFRSTDGKVHPYEGFTNYTVFSLWDTYRAYHPLMSILYRKRTQDWINTFLSQYKHGGMLPVWELAGNETYCMIGYHSVSVIADAYAKGIRGFDANLALEAMRSYAESDRFGLKEYRTLGYIPNDVEHESVSKTLEYAYDDWCIARFAEMTGQQDVATTYYQRSQNWKNVFDPQTGHMRGKVGAMWHSPFYPEEINNFFTEGNAWQYSFAVPQDVPGTMQLTGGQGAYWRKLNVLFETSSAMLGRQQPDVTGLIGQYAQGNEPSHHMAYLFQHANMPWKTEELISRIRKEFYTNAPDGLIGNEDCGQMSAWYVFSALGFYPLCPGKPEYTLGTPLFSRVTIHLEDGKQTVLVTDKSKSPGSHVQEVSLGEDYPDPRADQYFTNRSYKTIPHSWLEAGTTVTFHMGDHPLDSGQVPDPVPDAAALSVPITPVPFVQNAAATFSKSAEVKLGHVYPGASIFYRMRAGGAYQQYRRPVLINATTDLSMYAEYQGVKSPTVTQHFHKIPGDKDITVLSTPLTMYTAGGPLALIDGITGSTNWRSGGWQSYQGQDFEAVVDLRKIRPVSYVGIHVLQDASPWILYPQRVQYEWSADGKTYRPLLTATNAISPMDYTPQVQALGGNVAVKARYIRIRATSGGLLPAGHESAGQPSHLFIDEVLVR